MNGCGHCTIDFDLGRDFEDFDRFREMVSDLGRFGSIASTSVWKPTRVGSVLITATQQLSESPQTILQAAVALAVEHGWRIRDFSVDGWDGVAVAAGEEEAEECGPAEEPEEPEVTPPGIHAPSGLAMHHIEGRYRRFREYVEGLYRGADSPEAGMLADAAGTSTQRVIATARGLLATPEDHASATPPDSEEEMRALLIAAVESHVSGRAASVRDLQHFVESDPTPREALGARLVQHVEELGADGVDVEDLLGRTLAKVKAGPALEGGWDCPVGDAERIGFLLLLAERIWRGDNVDDFDLTVDTIMGARPGAVGPLARLGNEDHLFATIREGMNVFIGPPGSGKSTTLESVLLSYEGPVITTTTKSAEWRPELVAALLSKGPVYLFDATGDCPLPHRDVQLVRWSPLQEIRHWDDCRETARGAMTQTTDRANLTDGDFWMSWAARLVSVYLFAAWYGDRPMRDVATWIDAAEEAEVMGILSRAGDETATLTFAGIMRTDERAKSSMYATASNVTNAFQSHVVEELTTDADFDIPRFLESNGTVLMYADGMRTANTAPYYAAFLDAVITHRKRLSDAYWRGPHLLLALDEVANICPLWYLPRLLTEGPGRGIAGLFCFQDLRQATGRWGPDGEMFLYSSAYRLIFPRTTNASLHQWVVNLAASDRGEYERQIGFNAVFPPPGSLPPNEYVLTNADVAAPGEGMVTVVAPDATVFRARQARAYMMPDFVAAQMEGWTLHDPRNTDALEAARRSAAEGDEA